MLSMAEARRGNEVVTLAESTLIRFIDDITGASSKDIYERVAQCRDIINHSKREYCDKESLAELRSAYNEINRLLFIPEYLLLVVENESDYRRACEGFCVNGITYKRLLATAAGVKCKTIIFVDDSIRDELMSRLNNGRDMTMPAVPSKLESYMGLAASASKPVSAPRGVIVVKDCVTRFTDNYLLLGDSDSSDEPYIKEVQHGLVETNNSDGYGIATPSLLRRWASELGEDENIGGVCVRNAFCKGMVFPFDFYAFAGLVAKSDTIVDVWGRSQNIYEAELIITESMLKLWGSYDSYEDYARNCMRNGYSFSVTKVVEAKQRETRELNYQFIQPFELTDTDIDELVSPTVQDIGGVLGGDLAKALLYLRGIDQNERNTIGLSDDYVKALAIDPEVLNDTYVRNQISKMISKRADRAKLGRIRVNGDFNVVSGDPYALCQSMFGMEITGLLRRGAAHSDYWNSRNVSEVLAFRAPMTNGHSIRKLRLEDNPSTRLWYKYMHNVVILNAWDMIMAAENGCDCDGDTFLTTNNPVLLRCFKETLPIQCVQKKAEKTIPSEEDFIRANCASFGDEIGSVTNRITAMYDIASTYAVDTEERDTLEYRIICGQQYQQNSMKIRGAMW